MSLFCKTRFTINTKSLFLTISLLFFQNINTYFFTYSNDESITFKTILTGDRCTSVDYNIVNNQDGTIGGNIRLCGIHNMSIDIAGYETIHLVKNDVCKYPSLFTILSYVLRDDNMLVQRWSCVKWLLPLSFGFKIENGTLRIFSAITKYKILSPLRAKEIIPLIKKSDQNDINTSHENLKITVSINGRSATVEQKTIVQIYSISSLDPYAVLARMLFL